MVHIFDKKEKILTEIWACIILLKYLENIKTKFSLACAFVQSSASQNFKSNH